jgi:hypothetical protein
VDGPERVNSDDERDVLGVIEHRGRDRGNGPRPRIRIRLQQKPFVTPDEQLIDHRPPTPCS